MSFPAYSNFQSLNEDTISARKPGVIRVAGTLYEGWWRGKLYFSQGATRLVGGQSNRFGRLRAWGGDSSHIRDDNEADLVQNKAQRLGLSVPMGVSVERAGFAYNNKRAIDKQFTQIRKLVLNYKNYPVGLIWYGGHELALEAINPNGYDELNRMIRLIYQHNPAPPSYGGVAEQRTGHPACSRALLRSGCSVGRLLRRNHAPAGFPDKGDTDQHITTANLAFQVRPNET